MNTGSGPAGKLSAVERSRSIVLRAALFSALWWVLTGGDAHSWLVGAVTVALATAASLYLQPDAGSRVSLTALPAFLAFFIVQSLKGGIQVALMALRPRLDLQPAVMHFRLRLPQEPERIFLAAMLCLLPGTLSIGLDGKHLRLHVLDRRMPIEAEVRSAEARVARLFRVSLP